jgi:hypothetical protein
MYEHLLLAEELSHYLKGSLRVEKSMEILETPHLLIGRVVGRIAFEACCCEVRPGRLRVRFIDPPTPAGHLEELSANTIDTSAIKQLANENVTVAIESRSQLPRMVKQIRRVDVIRDLRLDTKVVR